MPSCFLIHLLNVLGECKMEVTWKSISFILDRIFRLKQKYTLAGMYLFIPLFSRLRYTSSSFKGQSCNVTLEYTPRVAGSQDSQYFTNWAPTTNLTKPPVIFLIANKTLKYLCTCVCMCASIFVWNLVWMLWSFRRQIRSSVCEYDEHVFVRIVSCIRVWSILMTY